MRHFRRTRISATHDSLSQTQGRERDSLENWQSATEVAGHKSASNRGDRGIGCKQSCFIFQETGIFVPTESRKWKISQSNQVTQY